MSKYFSTLEFQHYWLDETKDYIIKQCISKRRDSNTSAHEMALRLGLPVEKYLKVERFPKKHSLDFLLYFATWFEYSPYIELLPPYDDREDNE